MRKENLYLVISVLILLFCVSVAQAATMFHANPQHTGVYDDGGITPTNTLKWIFPTGNIVFSSPAVENGVVYVGSNDYKVYAINANTGSQVWSFTAGADVESSPAVANGSVYFGSQDKKVYALNATTGVQIWNFNTGGLVDSSPAVENGVVYIVSEDNKVYALDAITGAMIWNSSAVCSYYIGSPAVADGVVYVVNMSRLSIRALNAGSGVQLWEHSGLYYVDDSPVVAEGRVFIGNAWGQLHALNTTNGDELWYAGLPGGGGIDSTPAIANGVVYVGSGYNVYAVNATTGVVMWTFFAGNNVLSSPAVANGVVYIGSDNRKLFALNAITGFELWNYTTGGALDSSPAVANGVVYIGSWDGKLYAIGNATNVTCIQPDANFTATPTSGPAPLPVQFTDQSTGTPPLTYCWTFGDGGTSTVPNPSYIYTTPGLYTVNLTVFNECGNDTMIRRLYINVTDESCMTIPHATFIATPEEPTGGLLVHFTDTSTGNPRMWHWIFGDGAWFNTTNSTSRNTTHEYAHGGNYTVNLTIANACGETSTGSNYVIVNEPAGTLVLPNITAPAGTKRTLPVFIRNVTNSSGIRCTLIYDPAVIHVTNITPNATLSGAFLEYRIDNTTGRVNVSLSLTVPVTSLAQSGIFDITLSTTGTTGQHTVLSTDFAEWTNPDFGPTPLAVSNGRITIGGLRCDFNSNNRIDIGDVTRVAYMAVGLTPMNLDADFDHSGSVEVGDASKIVCYYVGKIPEL